MKKFCLALLIAALFINGAIAQTGKGNIDRSKVPAPKWHYQPEYTFDVTMDTAIWKMQNTGLNAAFGSTDASYLRAEVPFVSQGAVIWEETGWRGERLNAQVVLWSPDSIEQVRFRLSDLLSPEGKVISNNNMKLNLVRYVLSNFPYGAENFGCDSSSDSVWLLPDRLEPCERFDIPGMTVRPVWLTVDIPETAEPGEYRGTIEVSSLKEKVTLQLKIAVQQQVLPNPHKWKFRLDLWQNPWVVANYFQVAPWSEEHKALLKTHLKLYAEAGGKYVTTYAVHSPWSDNSFTLEETMIEWIKETGGSWKFDYSVFDQYVELAAEAGIDAAITIYTPLPWGNRFRYLDEKSGNYVYEEWAPSSEQFRIIWNLFLDDLKAHLTQKGWLNKTYLGVNENPMDITLAAIKVIKENSKDWKITYAGNWDKEISSLLDDYSAVISSEPDARELKERTVKGFTSTFYVCCNPPRPNNFVFSPPVEGRYIGWHALASGYDGFLRWAYDAWPGDPMRDARHTLWPAGDCFLVYPGGNSSVRFEKLREGIADYEKIIILRDLAAGSTNKKVKELMNDLEAHLATFIQDQDYNKRTYDVAAMTRAVQKGKKLINDLTDELGRN